MFVALCVCALVLCVLLCEIALFVLFGLFVIVSGLRV